MSLENKVWILYRKKKSQGNHKALTIIVLCITMKIYLKKFEVYHLPDVSVTIFINGLRIFLWPYWWNMCVYLNFLKVFCNHHTHLWKMSGVERPVGFLVHPQSFSNSNETLWDFLATWLLPSPCLCQDTELSCPNFIHVYWLAFSKASASLGSSETQGMLKWFGCCVLLG